MTISRQFRRLFRFGADAWQRTCASLVAFTLVAVGLPALTGTPALADTPPQTVTCSSEVEAFDFNTPSDTKTFQIYVPHNAKVSLVGSADIVGKDTSGGWQTILRMESDPDFFGGLWLLGTYWNGPYYNQNFDRSAVTYGGPSGLVEFELSQQMGSDVNGHVTFTITDENNSPVPCGENLRPEEFFGSSNPASNIKQCSATKYPVNCATGNFWHTFNDIHIPGRGADLGLTRTYNSLDAANDSNFGFGWSSNIDMSVALAGGVATVTQENGSIARFTEETSGAFTPPGHVLASLVKHGDGTWTFTRRHRDIFKFDSAGTLTSQVDRNGYVTSYSRPNANTLVVTEPAGRALTFNYTNNRVTGLTDPAGRTMSFGYDTAGNLTEAIDVAGGHWTFTYDSAHRMVTMREPKFHSNTTLNPAPEITNVYDNSGRVTSQSDQLGRTTTFAYGTDGTNTITDPAGNVEKQTYTEGLLTSKTKGFGSSQSATWTYTNDPATGSVTTETDPNNHVTQYSYDAHGNTTQETDALNNTTSATYNATGDLLSTTDALGRTSEFTYDTAGNLLTSKVAKAEAPATDLVTTYNYGDSTKPGDVTSVTDPTGKSTTFTYNTYGDVTSTTDPVGNKTTFTYNAPVSLGWKTSEVSPRGNVAGGTPANYKTTYSHDAMGRVTSIKDPLWSSATPTAHQASSTYDANGNVLTTTDGAGKTTTYTYNAAGELTATTRPDGSTQQTTFWPDGSIKSQIDGKNNATNYAYNALGQPTSTTDALGRVTSYSYDQVGNLLAKANHGGNCGTSPVDCTKYTYDANDQLKTIVYSDGTTPSVTYNYDALGRRTSMTDGTGTSTYSYDSLGRLVSTTNGAGQTMAYGYDNLGNQTSITYPGNKVVTKTYDDAGRNTSLTDWNNKTTTFGYDADSNLTSTAKANGMNAASTFDRTGQLTSINHTTSSGWSLAKFNGSYDGAGRLSSTGTTGYLAESTISYSYDQVSRLTGAGTASYGYDNADNATTLAGGTTQAFDAASQLTSSTKAGGTTYSYDTRGNRIQATPANGFATTSTYDLANRTKSVTSQATTPVSYNDAVKADNPDVYFRLDDQPNPNFFDSLDNSNYYGFLSGTAVRQAPGGLKGDENKAFNFYNNNGEGWLPDVPANTNPGGDTTVEMLVRWDGRSSSPEALFAFESNYQLTFANGNLGFSTKANASDIYGVSAANLKRRWVHIVAVFRNGNVTGSKLYIDGVAQTLTQKSGTPVSNSATRVASISGTDAGINHLTGSIDELAMWDSALNATQVANHAKAANSYTTSYSYDGDGLRSAKTSGGQTKTLTYDLTAPYAQLAFDGENYYIYGPDGLPLEQVRSSNGMTDWFSHDVLGNTRFMADDWANMSAAFSYDAYGNVTASEGRVDTPLKYRGEQQDNDTGYVYLRARYYDPQTAQFTTLDPLVSQTRSPYSYANNSPLNFADPSGEMPLVVGIWLVAEVGLAAADGLSMLATLSDPCATRGAKLAGVGFFAINAVAPGGGYGTAAKGAKGVGDGYGLVNRLRHSRYLASESQVLQRGIAFAGNGASTPFRGAQRAARNYGGRPEDWAKMRSDTFTDITGRTMETHWIENLTTGSRREFKTKFPNGL